MGYSIEEMLHHGELDDIPLSEKELVRILKDHGIDLLEYQQDENSQGSMLMADVYKFLGY